MDLSLLVIRSAIPAPLSEFYALLGLTFDYHRHGSGPYHYSARIGPTLLEIYPLLKSQEKPDTGLRLGFAIESFEKTLHTLRQKEIAFHQEPTVTSWGIMAIIADLEGRKIELYKR